MLTYVKGQGWIEETHPTGTLKCGTLVRFEFRQPELGESWDVVSRTSILTNREWINVACKTYIYKDYIEDTTVLLAGRNPNFRHMVMVPL